MTITRRTLIGGTLALAASGCIPPDQSPVGRLAAQLRLIEAAELDSAGGTLGAEIFEPATGASLGINQDRRFGHASSFKLSLAALVLQRHAAGAINADQRVMWHEADMIEHAPFTRARIASGATLRELAEATQTTSDNPAANILLRALGGPAALTAFWRSLGDEVSRIDRYEPEMNLVPETEFRDTTTPAAMARTVARLIYGDALPEAERAQLKQWMIATQTGLRRVRAGLPADWVAGDKTGTSGLVGTASTFVDIGFVEPTKDRAAITFAAYYRARGGGPDVSASAERVLMRVGRVIREFVERDKRLPIPNMFRQI
ncbi:MAG: class A beta-lactamase [Porphyrobacter sp.]|jgi:beta-lactamase class A|nr:class A beta-lactamase [Porphyrobacter sp.]